MPDVAASDYKIYGRVTDSDGNVVEDTVSIEVLLDLPVINLTAVDTLIDLNDSVFFQWSGN